MDEIYGQQADEKNLSFKEYKEGIYLSKSKIDRITKRGMTIFVMTLLISSVLQVSMAFGVFEKPTITVQANVDGNTGLVTISGKLTAGAGNAVKVIVINPDSPLNNRNDIFSIPFNQIESHYMDHVWWGQAAADGRYSFSYKLRDLSNFGDYKVFATGSDVSAPAVTSFYYITSAENDRIYRKLKEGGNDIVQVIADENSQFLKLDMGVGSQYEKLNTENLKNLLLSMQSFTNVGQFRTIFRNAVAIQAVIESDKVNFGASNGIATVLTEQDPQFRMESWAQSYLGVIADKGSVYAEFEGKSFTSIDEIRTLFNKAVEDQAHLENMNADINKDNLVDLRDIVTLYRKVQKQVSFSVVDIIVCDTNDDHRIDINDVYGLIKMISVRNQ